MYGFLVFISFCLISFKSINGNDEFVKKLSEKIQKDFRQKFSENVKSNSDLESF